MGETALTNEKRGRPTVERDDLVIPVYLNQRVVFDWVATLKGGIASVTQVSQVAQESEAFGARAQGTFGLSRALSSLLRIDLSGEVGSTTSGASTETQSEHRVHTPASLFIELRSLLHSKGYINQDSERLEPTPGSIIEFSASLRQNPLLVTLEAFLEVIDVMEALAAPSEGKLSGQSSGKKRGRPVVEGKPQIQAFVSALKTGDTMDLTTARLQCSYRAVITFDKQYLNDPLMTDLVDGTFRVVGKVSRVVGSGEEAVSLNRKSALGRLPPTVWEGLKRVLESPELRGFSLPELEWEVPGPVIQVLPIAIFA